MSISGKAFDVLLFLIEHRDRVVTKDELLAGVWQDTIVEEANLAQSISVLRKGLGEKPGENRYVVTLPGKGYQFASAVLDAAEIIPREPSRRRRFPWLPLMSIVGAVAVVVAIRYPFVTEGGGRTVRLTSWPGEEIQAAFSPDGNQVAFAATGPEGRNQDIYGALIGTGSTLRLTSHPASDSSPAWSPDGKYIAFYRGLPDRGYFVVPAIGGLETKVAEAGPAGKSNGRKLTWSSDGRSLVISERAKADGPRSLVAVSITTGEKHTLSHPDGNHGDEDPAISPDGSRLAFVRDFVKIFIADSNGDNARAIVVSPGIRGLAWAPDGKHLLYADMRTSGHNLWRVPASGGKSESVRAAGGEIIFPAMSRNGHKLVYSEFRQNQNIWRYAIGGRDDVPESKIIHSSQVQVSPQLSPDEQRIVFASDRAGYREIWVCNRDGGEPRQLTFIGGPHTGTPRWSPDSKTIVYDSYTGENPDIYAISADGGTPRNLTNHSAADITPSYSRDGGWIYFGSNRSGSVEVWRMPAAGGDAMQITRNGGMGPMEAFDGRTLYYSKLGENAGVWRVPPEGGTETLAVRDVAYWGWWTVAETGIYFLQQDPSANTIKLQFLSFTGKISMVREFSGRIAVSDNVLSVDRSGRTLLLEQIGERAADLIIVEGLR